MNRPTSPSDEAQQRYYDRDQKDKQYSYDLTKQLTYFVISAELVFCGYILLNAEVLGGIRYSSILFLMAGTAAICGILWRVCYNEIFHANTHGIKAKFHKLLKLLNLITYWFYVILSIVFFIILLITGYKYLSNIEVNTSDIVKQYQSVPEQQLNKKFQMTAKSARVLPKTLGT